MIAAEWAPTIVSAVVGIYTCGVEVGSRRAMRRVQVTQGKQIEHLRLELTGVDRRVSTIEGRLMLAPAR